MATAKKPVTKKTATKAAAKKTVAKKTTTKKVAAKKPATKKTATKAAVKKTTAKATTKKATTTKAKKPVKVGFELQYGRKHYTVDALTKLARDQWRKDHKKKIADLKKMELYVNAEERKLYYVANGSKTEKGEVKL